MIARPPLVVARHPVDALFAQLELAGGRLLPHASDPEEPSANDRGPAGQSANDGAYAELGARVLPYARRA